MQVFTKGAGFPRLIGGPGNRVVPIPWGLINEVSLTVKGQTSYHARLVAGRSVYRGRMGQARYLEHGSIDTATTRLNGTSRTKNLIIEFQGGFEVLDELQNDVRTCLTHAVGNAFDNR